MRRTTERLRSHQLRVRRVALFPRHLHHHEHHDGKPRGLPGSVAIGAAAVALALDHIFVMCDAGAPELSALEAIGLDGPPRRSTHAGQGTANACVVFENAFLELVWVHDEHEARSPVTAPTRLWDRWAARGAGACPFGIGLRPEAPGDAPPFATWPYRPSYLPAGLSIDMATDLPLGEPELFFLASARPRPDFRELAARHAAAFGPLTAVTIELPGAAALSPACAAVQAAGVVRFVPAARHALRLGFGTRAAGRSADLRPTLPIALDW
jgi:hypothetical protein